MRRKGSRGCGGLLSICGTLLASGVLSCAEPVTGAEGLDAGIPCQLDANCPTGLTCQQGVCRSGSILDGGSAVSDGGTRPDGGSSDGGTQDGGASEDAGPPDAGLLADFGEPCVNDASCQSGICIQSSLGSVCTRLCSQDCPPDWGCKVVQIRPNATAAICFPGADLYCIPCTTDDCANPGDHCTQMGGASYCTRDCTASGTCPTGFECVAVQPADGGFLAPPPDGGTADAGLGASDGGVVRQCLPVTRLCPGCIDHDGDGYGIGADCLGPDCDDHDPNIHPGATEICDGRDNNCDGQIDEGFDLMNDVNNCGACSRPGDPHGCATDGSQLCCAGVCRNLRTDDANCGGCGVASTGKNICQTAIGEHCCDGNCHNTLNDPANCGGCRGVPRACMAGTEACCNGVCTTLLNNDLACGSCTLNCSTSPNGKCCGTACYDKLNDVGHCGDACVACMGGDPACCSGSCADRSRDTANCGACGHACNPSESCCSGTCKNLNTDPANCGACGHTCALGQTCCGGQCLNLGTDPNNCGLDCASRIVCQAPTATCCGGACINATSDDQNCGRCSNACNTGAGERCCLGLCKNLQSDTSNCGGCGTVCDLPNTATYTCQSGGCRVATCDPGYYDLDGKENNGCECLQGPNEPDNTWQSASFLGNLSDGSSGNTATRPTRIVPTTDIDWFTFNAQDNADIALSDSFHIHVELDGLPSGTNYELKVYRGTPDSPNTVVPSNDPVCCNGIPVISCNDFSVPGNLTANSNGNPSVSIDGWDGHLGCEDGATFYVSIRQLSGPSYCGDITLTVTNGG
jgi:hypothetical protein